MLGENWFTPGGWSYRYDSMENDQEIKEYFNNFKPELEGLTNQSFESFEPMYFKQQVVAGLNYEVLYDLGFGEGFL